MKLFLVVTLLSSLSFAGVLPTSRGGSGKAITPSLGSMVYSTSSGFSLSVSNIMPNGSSIIVPANTTTATGGAGFMITAGTTLGDGKQPSDNGTIESDGAHLYWINSSGDRKILDN